MLQRERDGLCEVDERFRDFDQFLDIVGQKEAPEQTLDRIDSSDPEYGPLKVRWASKRAQTRNRRNTIWLTYEGAALEGAQGVKLTLNDWAGLTGQNPSNMRRRRGEGWTDTENIDGKRSEREVPFSSMSERRLLDYQPWPKQIAQHCEAQYAVNFDKYEDRFDYLVQKIIPRNLHAKIEEGRQIALYLRNKKDLERAFACYPDAEIDDGRSLPVRNEVWCPYPDTDVDDFEDFLSEYEAELADYKLEKSKAETRRNDWQKAMIVAVNKPSASTQSEIREKLKSRFTLVEPEKWSDTDV